MRSRISLALALTTCLGAISTAGCDGNGGPVLVPDSGPEPSDSGPPRVDAVVPDTQPPRVTATSPEQGARGVAVSAPIEVTFSEAMDESAGTVSLRAGTETREVDTEWGDDGTTLTITPRAPLPGDARVVVTIDDDFADRAGNELALPYQLVFQVADVAPPVVVSSDPAHGATDLSARIDELTITFDEQMDNSVGALALSGGAGTIGAIQWLDGRTLRAPLSGLAYETTYRIALSGFTDASGNALDGSVYLDDGAIELTTGEDDDAPGVVDSVPAEGQVNVALRGTPSVVIVFDEPMDTSAGTATLRAGGLETTLAGTWSEGGRRLTMPIAGRLYPDAPHSVVLTGFVDLAGNALEPTAYLGDGALDFQTGADATVPVVVFSYPNEGSATSDHQLERIEIAFDRAMDTEAVETLRIDDGEAPFDAEVTWNLAGTRAYVDVSERMRSGRRYAIDLRSFVDLNGDPVDPDAPYLGDGVLDFATRAPRGDQCRDELRVSEATSMLPGGGYEWVIAETTMQTADNGPACRITESSGSYSSAYSPDAVVFYRKTSAAGSAGGRYLHVTGEVAATGVLTPNRVTLAVYRDVCGEQGPGGREARVTCQWDRTRWEQYLDVGEGDYYVWVASVDSAAQDQLTVRIEEVDSVPAGESCVNPLRASASEPTYTPPSGPDGEHVWEPSITAYHGSDMGDSWPGEGAISCDQFQVQGVDYVVEIDKESPDTLVRVLVEPVAAGISDALHVEALSTCNPTAPGATAYAASCGLRTGTASTQGPRLLTFEAPAGPFYLWTAADLPRSGDLSARLRVREIPAAPGTSCENAIPIAATGTTPITPSSLARLDVPSCMQTGALADGITWYRLTTTESATLVRTDVAGTPTSVGAFAMIDVSTGRELQCGTDATAIPALALLPAGRDVCIAVRNGSGVGALQVEQVPYDGNYGVPTHLGIERPLDPVSSAEINITSDTWMALTPTVLYMGVSSGSSATSTNGVMVVNRGATASEFQRFTQMGNSGVAIGEALWSLDDVTTANTERLFRLVNDAGTFSPVRWDTGATYGADGFDAMTYDGTSILVANDYASASLPVQLRTFSPTVAGPGGAPITVHADLRDVVAIAADATWLYLAGGLVEGSTTVRGVYRVARAQLGTMRPERIATIPMSTTRTALVVDSLTAAQYLYVRASTGDVHAIMDPGGTTPRHVGVISTLGGSGDAAMTIDHVTGSLYLFETETNSTGNFVRLD